MERSQIAVGQTYHRLDFQGAMTRVDAIRDGRVIGHTYGRALSTACVIPLERFAAVASSRPSSQGDQNT